MPDDTELDILDMKMTIFFRPIGGGNGHKRYYNRPDQVEQRPASLAYFTLRQIIHMLSHIQLRPGQKTHFFNFGGDRFEVNIYNPADDES